MDNTSQQTISDKKLFRNLDNLLSSIVLGECKRVTISRYQIVYTNKSVDLINAIGQIISTRSDLLDQYAMLVKNHTFNKKMEILARQNLETEE